MEEYQKLSRCSWASYQISVAKYYPYEVPLVLDQIVGTATSGVFPATVAGAVKGYEIELNTDPTALGVKIGDIVSSFPGQGAQELWEVIYIEKPGRNTKIRLFYKNHFKKYLIQYFF